MSILGFALVNSARNTQIDHLKTSLTNEARLVADTALPVLDNPATADALAKSVGSQISARVTIIAADGTVLGDSWEDPAVMENHANRPEVIEALKSGVGISTRYSSTTGESMLYAAVPISNQGNPVGVARVELSLEAVNDSVSDSVRNTILAVALAALVVILAASFIIRMITRPTRRLTRAAVRIASGQFGQQIEIQSTDELGRLGRAFNRMSTNLQETMTAAAEEKNKLVTILSSLEDGVVMTDARGNILLANTAAENLFNFKADRAEGKPLIETIINHEVDDLLKKCLSTQQKQTASVDTTSGKFLRVLAVPLKTARISGALILFQDLTELRNLQTMRRMFVGNVSHELRTPLAGIKAVIETLQDGAVNDPQAAMEFLDKAHAETDSMTQMIDELIELSRIETGRTKLELAEMDLNQLAGEVIGRLTVQAERKQITVRTEFAPDLPAVKADRQRMQEVITNILHNAIKFTPSGGRIEIKTQSAENAVTLRVTDTGIGISQDDLPHIFERFFKADKSRTREGSGLGLAIAKHIIQAHGGKIWVESREGQGSTFGFSLPSFKA